MKIGLSYDLKDSICLGQGHPEDALEEYDSPETVNALAAAIEAQGHSAVRLGGGREFLSNITQCHVDFVFNIAEGLGNHLEKRGTGACHFGDAGYPLLWFRPPVSGCLPG